MPNNSQGGLFFDARFVDGYAGQIVSDPYVAITELVANSWDAYATKVEITWPGKGAEQVFSIKDNGHGMTREEFEKRWKTLFYNRRTNSTAYVEPPAGVTGAKRAVFGKNGKGRFAGFCFSSAYKVTSRKNGKEFTCLVELTPTDDKKPLGISILSESSVAKDLHGTEIIACGEKHQMSLSEDEIRENLAGKFLVNPSFIVCVNKIQISFKDIEHLVSEQNILIEPYGNVQILHIDTKKADKSTKHSGVAWWVQDRLVGSATWSASDYEKILDGRSTEAKRFTFIVRADFLNDVDAIRADWTGFNEDNQAWIKTKDVVQKVIKDIITQTGIAEREDKKLNTRRKVGNHLNTLSYLSRETVGSFIDSVVDSCPQFGEAELVQLATILSKLEKAKTKYGLLELLSTYQSDDYDALVSVLLDWNVNMAKIVLDEIQNRMKLIEELSIKIEKVGIDEVQELQPLFESGLWMFGAEFESIEYTSNLGMTKVVRKLLDPKVKAGVMSRNRPDFVVVPDGAASFYSRPSFNEQNEEDGVEQLVVIDLKTTGLSLGGKEKDQVWKYVKELQNQGYLKKDIKVHGFVLGDKIESGEENARTENNGLVNIQPVLYNTILSRAKARLLGLHQKVKNAPFLENQRQELEEYLSEAPIDQIDLDLVVNS